MQLVISFIWNSGETMAQTSELDDALTNCLSEFGFKRTNISFDRQKREHVLEFEGGEMLIKKFQQCPQCGWKNLPDDPECFKCQTELSE
jgi:hypothetical protein